MKKIDKERKKRVMDYVEKVNSDEYETSYDENFKVINKKKSKVKMGKASRARGARFELKVRGDLEGQGWIMDKWTNNVDLLNNKLVKAKRKYNPFKKMLIVGTGFPDFIAFKKASKKSHEVIGVEVKINGTLSKIEKEKCAWYLKKGIFSKILVAKSVQEGRRINVEYDNFSERYTKFLSNQPQ